MTNSLDTLKNLQSFKIKHSLQQLAMTFIANRLQSQEEHKRLTTEFANLDINGDGLLQHEELKSGYIKLGKTPEEADFIVSQLMPKIDVNGNGSIDFSEFITASIRMHEVLDERQLQEAFKLFDKVKIILL